MLAICFAPFLASRVLGPSSRGQRDHEIHLRPCGRHVVVTPGGANFLFKRLGQKAVKKNPIPLEDGQNDRFNLLETIENRKTITIQ